MDEYKKKYYKRLEFEHELINHRITWLLSSQTLLFAGYGFAGNRESQEISRLLKTVAVVGYQFPLTDASMQRGFLWKQKYPIPLEN